MLPLPFLPCFILTRVLKLDAKLSSIFLKLAGRLGFTATLTGAMYCLRTSSSVCLTERPFFFISLKINNCLSTASMFHPKQFSMHGLAQLHAGEDGSPYSPIVVVLWFEFYPMVCLLCWPPRRLNRLCLFVFFL